MSAIVGALIVARPVRFSATATNREARTGRLEMAEATGLAYLLSIMSALLKDTALEERVRVLEEANGATA